MAGAFMAYYAVIGGLPLWIAALIAMIGSGLLSYVIELVAFKPLRARGEIEFAALISSIGVNLMLTSAAQRISKTKVVRFPFGTFPAQYYSVFGLRISLLQIVIAAIVAALLLLLLVYIYRTSFGRQIRAVSSNERAARLLGVSPAKVYFQTFFISGALAGMAGVLIGLSFNSINFLMGEPYLLRAFVVVVLGGLGSIHGAVVAGLLLGMLQTLTVAFLPTGLADAIIFSLLFVILLIRPSGLFGTAAASVGVARQ
jgi:branched-chain amino acid transport system permease protein